jgi:uncharacterized membrane protein YczE
MKKKLYLLAFLGNVIIALGVSFLNLSSFGLDPYTSMVKGLSALSYIPLGTVQLCLNILVYLPVLYFNRKAIGFGSLVNLFVLGYMNQGFITLWSVLGLPVTLPLRILYLIIGLLLVCFGVALYMDTNLGVAPYDGVAPLIDLKTNHRLPFQYARILTDAICVGTGFTCGYLAQVTTSGAATLFVMFGTGPFVHFFSQKVTLPLADSINKAV